MVSKIPKEIREQLENDPYMLSCINENWECRGRIQFHHAFQYASKQVSELWSILGLCEYHHKKMTKHTQTLCRMNLRARIAHFKAREEFDRRFPKSDLFTNN